MQSDTQEVKIYNKYKELNLKNPVVTIGMFDGAHLGHQEVLRKLTDAAKRTGGESVVIIFEPHPRLVLSPGNNTLRFLTSLEEKAVILERAGIDNIVILPFTYEFSRLTACEFVKEVLLDGIGIKHLVVGFDHRFGRRNGDEESIEYCAGVYSLSVEKVNALSVGGMQVSSTRIREYLANGKLDDANELLGYDYFFKGSVIEGLKLGRAMGYPTANLKPDFNFKLIPASGVYAVEVELDGNRYDAMLYIGTRPTLSESDGSLSIEAHLLDYHGDLYGKSITIHFISRLRGDIKFADKDLLREQIDKDREDTIKLLRG